MAAATYDFTVEQGTTMDVPVTYMSGTPAVPVVVTGWTARMQIRSSISSSTIIAEFTTENGGIAVEGPDGIFRLKATDTQTSDWKWSSGVYDLEVIDTNGKVTRLLKGKVSVDPGVTRTP